MVLPTSYAFIMYECLCMCSINACEMMPLGKTGNVPKDSCIEDLIINVTMFRVGAIGG